VGAYDHLLRNGRPRNVRDHTAAWNRLAPIADASPTALAAVEAFCDRKRITVAALEALGTRVTHRGDMGLCLAYAGRSPATGHVVAIKYRPINGTSHDSVCEKPSVWLRPIIVGNRDSLDWLILEGETDAARLYELVGDRCAILVLPTGARTFEPAWRDPIPRGATVRLCHDADADGDAGADRQARIIGGRTIRVRPPIEGGDWCDWEGDREAFIRLAQPPREVMHVVTLEEFADVDEPGAAALLGEGEDAALIPEGGDVMSYGDGGAGKTTLAVDLACHLAAGEPWLGIAVNRAANVLLIENEGPRPMFRRKLRRKLKAWTGAALAGRVRVFERPWREFSFASDHWRAELARVVAEHEIDLVIAGPLTRIGMDGPGTLQEVAAFMDLVWSVREPLDRPLAVLLIHHENKGGAVSGAWEGSGDTLLHVEAAGNGHTVVFVQKARWDKERHQTTMKLAWADGEGYELEGDRDLLAEVEAFLAGHPWRTVKQISASRDAAEPGIGANRDAVRDLLDANPERFESCTGNDAKALGRHPSAVVWRWLGAPEPPESPRLFDGSPGGGRKGGGSGDSPLRESPPDESPPPDPPGEGQVVTQVAEPSESDQERAERLADHWRGALEHDDDRQVREEQGQ
jgi:hypothetical protein